mgnify:FL=1
MYEWTAERLEALSDPELKTLLGNAERKSADDLAAKCKAVLEARNALKPSRVAKPRTELKELEHAVSEQLAAVGNEMAAKYDLSEETAKARSADVKGFRAHKLLDSKGSAKLGGMQRDGSVAIERYISYRCGDQTAYLGVFLLKDAPLEDREFHVIASKALLEGGKPIAEIRPTATDKQKQPADSGLVFKDLAGAAAAFDAALARITA